MDTAREYFFDKVEWRRTGATSGGWLFAPLVAQRSGGLRDGDYNFNCAIQDERMAKMLREIAPSGILKRNVPEVLPELSAYDTNLDALAITNQLQFANFRALVNGWLLNVENATTEQYEDSGANTVAAAVNTDQNYCTVRLPDPPTTSGSERYDLVWLEVFLRQITSNVAGATTDCYVTDAPTEIDLYGNTQNDETYFDNLTNNIQYNGLTVADGVQLQYRLRVSDTVTITSNPEGLGDTVHVLPQGGLDAPVSGTGYGFFNAGIPMGGSDKPARNYKDDGLWICGDGSELAAQTLGTVDGYIYAIPLFIVHRKNGYAWSNGQNLNGTACAIPATASHWSYGQTWATDRPDKAYYDKPTWKDIIDLRHDVHLNGVNYQEIFEETWTRLLRGELFTKMGTNALHAEAKGRTLLHQDVICSGIAPGGAFPGGGLTYGTVIANPVAHPQNSGRGWRSNYSDGIWQDPFVVYSWEATGSSGVSNFPVVNPTYVHVSIPAGMTGIAEFVPSATSVTFWCWHASGPVSTGYSMTGLATGDTMTGAFDGTAFSTGDTIYAAFNVRYVNLGSGTTYQPRTLWQGWAIESGFTGPIAVGDAQLAASFGSGDLLLQEMFYRASYAVGHGPCTADADNSGYTGSQTTDRMYAVPLQYTATSYALQNTPECWRALVFVNGDGTVDIGESHTYKPLKRMSGSTFVFNDYLYGNSGWSIEWCSKVYRAGAGNPTTSGGGALTVNGIWRDETEHEFAVCFNDGPAVDQVLMFEFAVGKRQIGVRGYAKSIDAMAQVSNFYSLNSGDGAEQTFYLFTSGVLLGAGLDLDVEGLGARMWAWDVTGTTDVAYSGVVLDSGTRLEPNLLRVRTNAPLTAGHQIKLSLKWNWAVDPDAGQMGFWYDHVPYQGQQEHLHGTLQYSDMKVWSHILGPQYAAGTPRSIAGAGYRLPMVSGVEAWALSPTGAANLVSKRVDGPYISAGAACIRNQNAQFAYLGDPTDSNSEYFAMVPGTDVEMCAGATGTRGLAGWTREGEGSTAAIVGRGESSLYGSGAHNNCVLGLCRMWNYTAYEDSTTTMTLTGVVGTFTAGERIVGGTSAVEAVVNAYTGITATTGTLTVSFEVPDTGFTLGETITGQDSGATADVGTYTGVTQKPTNTPSLALVVGSAYRTSSTSEGFDGSAASGKEGTDVVDVFLVPRRDLTHIDLDSTPWEFPS